MNSFIFIQKTVWMYSNNNKGKNRGGSEGEERKPSSAWFSMRKQHGIGICGDNKLWIRITSGAFVLSSCSQLRLQELLSLLHVAFHWERRRKHLYLISLCFMKTNRLRTELCKAHSVFGCRTYRVWGHLVRRHTCGWHIDRWCQPSLSLWGLWRDYWQMSKRSFCVKNYFE